MMCVTFLVFRGSVSFRSHNLSTGHTSQAEYPKVRMLRDNDAKRINNVVIS